MHVISSLTKSLPGKEVRNPSRTALKKGKTLFILYELKKHFANSQMSRKNTGKISQTFV